MRRAVAVGCLLWACVARAVLAASGVVTVDPRPHAFRDFMTRLDERGRLHANTSSRLAVAALALGALGACSDSGSSGASGDAPNDAPSTVPASTPVDAGGNALTYDGRTRTLTDAIVVDYGATGAHYNVDVDVASASLAGRAVFAEADVGVDRDGNGAIDDGEYLDVVDGTVSLAIVQGGIELAFDVLLVDGRRASGRYDGPATYFDERE